MGFITDLELEIEQEKEAFDKLPQQEQQRILQEKKLATAKLKEKVLARQAAKRRNKNVE